MDWFWLYPPFHVAAFVLAGVSGGNWNRRRRLAQWTLATCVSCEFVGAAGLLFALCSI